MTYQEIFKTVEDDGHRFQKELAEFVVANRLETAIETGAGVSSLYIVRAIDENNFGKLYSIDPNPWCNFEIEHPRYELIRQKSVDALPELFRRLGSLDLFLHDGNHDIFCQTFEFDLAYACLRDGGYLAADDHTWGQHGAWSYFLKENGLKSIKMGSVEIVQKPKGTHVVKDVLGYAKHSLLTAKIAEDKWLRAGNKNSDVFKDQ